MFSRYSAGVLANKVKGKNKIHEISATKTKRAGFAERNFNLKLAVNIRSKII
jgi:hypothetical protein